MTVDLAADVEKFLRERLPFSTNANDFVNDVLRSLRELQQQPLEVTPELEAWLMEAADSPTTPLTSADFDGIRERVRASTPSPGS